MWGRPPPPAPPALSASDPGYASAYQAYTTAYAAFLQESEAVAESADDGATLFAQVLRAWLPEEEHASSMDGDIDPEVAAVQSRAAGSELVVPGADDEGDEHDATFEP